MCILNILKYSLLLILYFYFNIPISENIILKDNKVENYYALLEIPKINLKKELYEKNSPLNNIDKNLMIIGNMPNEIGYLVIAGHSGVGDIAYFNNLIYLEINDEINVYYDDKTYKYKVFEIYEIEKTGKLYLNKNEKNIIVLVTCKVGTNKQLIYKGILKKVD